jgi:hypothetical protein
MMAKHPESKLLNDKQVQQEPTALYQTFGHATNYSRNLLLFDGDTYLIPTKTFLILKRLKKIDMKEGAVTVDYTHLVWMNLKGLPAEIQQKLSGEEPIKYRINQTDIPGGFQHPVNSNIRKSKDDILTITYRGEAELPMFGDIKFSPFSNFKMEFVFELTHFELDI